jgi:hypothetical protein
MGAMSRRTKSPKRGAENPAPGATATQLNTDYDISICDAQALRGATLLPNWVRLAALKKYRKERGSDALLNLFSQFIGLANSVVENNRVMAELVLIAEGGINPYKAEKINLPTIHGALNGVVLAASVKQEKTCLGCAFRLGTPANQSPSTTVDAQSCVDDLDGDFMCHENLPSDGEPTRKCIGFAQAVRP